MRCNLMPVLCACAALVLSGCFVRTTAQAENAAGSPAVQPAVRKADFVKKTNPDEEKLARVLSQMP